MKTITIDPRKCVGCRNCEMACAFEKSQSSCEVEFANIRINDYIKERFVVPMTCFHCEEAWCMKVCPAHAISFAISAHLFPLLSDSVITRYNAP